MPPRPPRTTTSGRTRARQTLVAALGAACALACRSPLTQVRIENRSGLDVPALTCSLIAPDGAEAFRSSASLRVDQSASFRSDVVEPMAVLLVVEWRAGEPPVRYELGRLPPGVESALVELLEDYAVRFSRSSRP